MKKFVYILFMAFLLVSCGKSHHQITGSVDYCFEGDSITYTIPFKYDYYYNKLCENMDLKALLSLDNDSSALNVYIVPKNNKYSSVDYYNLVSAPGKRIVYSNLNYKYTVKID